jgi:hypothetical protein
MSQPEHPVPHSERQGTYCEDYEKTGCSVEGCPTSCYHNPSPVAAVLTKHRPTYPNRYSHTWFCTGCPYAGVGWGQWVEHADAMIAEELELKLDTRPRLTRQEARDLYDRKVRELCPDPVILARLDELRRDEADDDDESLLRKRVI